MFKQVLKELRRHFPFTAFVIFTGIITMIIFYKILTKIFYLLYTSPFHIFLCALVTTSMDRGNIYLGFINEVSKSLAFTDIAVPYFKPPTKFPRFGHVLLNTWAFTFLLLWQ